VATLHLFPLFRRLIGDGDSPLAPAHRCRGSTGLTLRYHRRMTPLTPATLAAPLPASTRRSHDPLAGLTDTDAARIAEAMTAAHAASTRAAYACAWRVWQRWCHTRGLAALPATPAAVCAYLTERAAAGVSVPTLDLACSAIAYQHRNRGAADPVTHPAVRRVRRGLRHLIGTAPRRVARPLGTAEIRRIVARIDRTSALGARDAALILLGFASALRRSELAALTLADIEARPDGLLVTIRGSKTDPARRGQVVGVAHGLHTGTDPVAALAAWTRLRGTTPGPLFTSMRGRRVTLTPISGDAVVKVLKTRAAAAGLATERITGHSLRAGHATTAAAAGASLDRIAAQTRHRRLSTLLEHYLRPVEALRLTTSRDLGL